MKLAFCLFNYFPYGGLQRDFLRIAQEAVRRGHEVHVYTMKWEGALEPTLHIHLIPITAHTNHTRNAAFAKTVMKQLQDEQFDLVVGFNKMPGLDIYYAADVCYQARVREQRSWWYRLSPRFHQLKKLEEAVFARGNKTHILLISALQQAAFEQHYQTEATRFHLLPPGIAKDRIAPSNAAEIRLDKRKLLKLHEQDLLILMVGSGFKTKGLDRALIAFSALPAALKTRCHLFVVGQDQTHQFKTLAKKLKIAERVQFLGGRPDVSQLMLAADLLLHPAYHENTGTVLLEAMVSGLPVLTTDVCGYAHYVQEAEAGMVLSSPFSQVACNAALQTMLQSPDRHIWQQHGLAFAKTGDIYSLPEKAVDVIEQAGLKT